MWEAIQPAKAISRGEIFESAVLDEGQEFGNSTWLPSLWLAKQMFTRQKNGFYANLWAKTVNVVGHRKVKLDLSIADQKLSCKHGCSKL